MKRIVIVGMGFGGLNAAQVLAGQDVEVLLLDRNNYHLFQPLLYQVATANLEQENIAYPIRAIIRRWGNVRFMVTEVRALDLAQRQLQTDVGAIPYDGLILAVGSVPSFFGMQSVAERALALKQLGDGVALRNHILTMFERAAREPDATERASLLTFVVVGAGPTGVEFSGALAELIHHTLGKDYPELRGQAARLLLVEAQEQVLAMLPHSLQQYAEKRLRQLGVEVLLGKTVRAVEEGRVLFKDGSALHAHTLVWTAGVQAATLAEGAPAPKGPGHRIRVQPDLSLPEHPEVLAVGDMIYLEQDGGALPMVAPVAMQEGAYAGRALLRRLRGQPVAPFHYRDKGTMAIIGRYAAVARTFGVNLWGLAAWVVWLTLHLYFLVGFRNRLIALLNWVYAYFFRDPKVRLITHAPEER